MDGQAYRQTPGCGGRTRTVNPETILLGFVSGLVAAFMLVAIAGIQNASGVDMHIADSAEPTDPALSPPNSPPVIGGGVRNPPDIGAAGTGTVQDPIRSESPTEEPSIVPPITPPLSEKSDSIETPLPKKPLGKPEMFPDRKSEPDTLPDVKK